MIRTRCLLFPNGRMNLAPKSATLYVVQWKYFSRNIQAWQSLEDFRIIRLFLQCFM